MYDEFIALIKWKQLINRTSASSLKKLFENYDVNKDNSIDKNDVLDVMASLNLNVSVEEIDLMLTSAAEKSDGRLTFIDFTYLANNCLPQSTSEQKVKTILVKKPILQSIRPKKSLTLS
ncbi:unnamed protein product [Didymodactylos carnosus]|uniref:EF-hand domain-containing protein n=1 Tax=Didymodactylos carnosus TaxID=1234261 RepID=A0A814Q5B0_9BILA|nr:unnamed protein product [Didymodactylos carnosus]CAF3878496.1 unnamed protein product [Didymodactylos carnosus]